MTTSPIISLIGCGKMGGAMLRGWLAADNVTHVDILEPYGHARLPKTEIFTDTAAFIKDARKPDIIVLAVKPQMMAEVCTALKNFTPPHALILSIAAGKTIASFETIFGASQPVIRVMPNTPAAIGKGISVAVANKHVTPAQRETAHALLTAIGMTEWIDDEALMNAVTAVSGSGPAYVFHLIEVLATAGERAGLSPALSMKLARQTVIGSAALAETDTDLPASKLRENVTSPGGTTAAALEVLMNGDLQKIYDRAIGAATQRGRELAG